MGIPWFNNIWLNDTPRSRASAQRAAHPPGTTAGSYRPTQSRQDIHSSSYQTVSTMSAVDRVSLCSLPSIATARCSAQDLESVLQTLSQSNSSDFLAAPIPHSGMSLADPDTKVSLHLRLLQLRSAELRAVELRKARMKSRAVKVSSAANIATSHSVTKGLPGKARGTLLRTR